MYWMRLGCTDICCDTAEEAIAVAKLMTELPIQLEDKSQETDRTKIVLSQN